MAAPSRSLVLVLALARAAPSFAQEFEETKLTAYDQVAGAEFGCSLSQSEDTVLIGAQGDASGAVYVLVRSCDGWDVQTKLKAVETLNLESETLYHEDHFGRAVAISGDVAVIGAPNAWEPWIYSGVAYLFERTGTHWSGHAVQSSHGSNYQWFGSAVAADGDTVMISAPQTLGVGRVEVHVREAGLWKLQKGLFPPSGSYSFGGSLALHGDTALIGARDDHGVTYVFVREGTIWHQQAELTASDAVSGDAFGDSVSLDGDVALIGARYDDERPGAAYVFTRSGSVWSEEAKLTPSGSSPGDHFGTAVCIEGDFALVGASGANAETGAAYLFERSGDAWIERVVFEPGGAHGDRFGEAVSMSHLRLLVGARGDDENGPQAGAAFDYIVPAVHYCTSKTNSLGCLPSIGSCGQSSAARDSGFVVLAERVRNRKVGLMLYGLSGRAKTTYQGGLLCMAAPVFRAPASDSDGHLPPIDDCSGVYRLDVNAFAAGHIGGEPRPELRTPGTQVQCQWWARDPDDAYGSSLSDALEYHVGP